MLSICIPHYNFNNPKLFFELERQCLNLEIIFEIVIIDDASPNNAQLYLEQFKQPNFKVFFLQKNIGRSAIRNLLAEKAQYPHLLFLDADAGIIDDHFIGNYLNYLDDQLVVGGRIYLDEKPNKNNSLHWNYGKFIEQFIYQHLHTNNFLTQKSLFDILRFDENLKDYGFEDVVFGLKATELGIDIKFIENPIIHIDLKTNAQYMNDVKGAINNLILLSNIEDYSPLLKSIQLYNSYLKLKKYHLHHFISIGNRHISKFLEKQLVDNPNNAQLLLLKFYKLYYLHGLLNHK